ncbi:MAG: AAA-like domain-containing protein [Blastocatellia bacterium]|nr:AAA-like domain-containing protein [Blastocatellia bacterium]
MSDIATSFYVTGGTLRRDAQSYVQRNADRDLYESLYEGKFCYVLTSRQMGKSSLMVRTAVRLREESVAVAVLDLTALGQNLTAEQWYDGLLSRIGQQLDIEEELEDFWLSHTSLGPLQRWMQAIREVVLARLDGRVVIFVDEIDAVRSLPFSTDEFFAGIREFYNRRTEDTELERLTFCLLGVATPTDLIRDTSTTPFNVGQRIELNDFTEAEAAPLAKGITLSRGLGRTEKIGATLLKRILYWTGGHPYLTQRLCQAVAEDTSITNRAGVDRICESMFLSSKARERDDNLLFVRERMLRSEADVAGLLDLYAKVRNHKRVQDDERNSLVAVLRLSGITRVMEGYLFVRNRIYYRVFDREWVRAEMPDAEVRRQKAAYRRGLLRATAVAAVILAVMAALVIVAIRERNRAEAAASLARMNEQIAEEKTRKVEETLKQLQEQKQMTAESQKLAEEERLKREDDRQQMIWEMIKDDANPLTFQAYLEMYPKGSFASQARRQQRDARKRLKESVAQNEVVTTGVIIGRVYDTATDQPLIGAKVIARKTDTGAERRMDTGADGRCMIALLEQGTYRVTISHDGYDEKSTGITVKPDRIARFSRVFGGLNKKASNR